MSLYEKLRLEIELITGCLWISEQKLLHPEKNVPGWVLAKLWTNGLARIV